VVKSEMLFTNERNGTTLGEEQNPVYPNPQYSEGHCDRVLLYSLGTGRK
jgi:hypothetical protein